MVTCHHGDHEGQFEESYQTQNVSATLDYQQNIPLAKSSQDKEKEEEKYLQCVTSSQN